MNNKYIRKGTGKIFSQGEKFDGTVEEYGDHYVILDGKTRKVISKSVSYVEWEKIEDEIIHG